jgi:hypothetical protein
MELIYLAQDREQWRALVNTAMNLRLHKVLEISWMIAQLTASQEGPSFMKLVKSILELFSWYQVFDRLPVLHVLRDFFIDRNLHCITSEERIH